VAIPADMSPEAVAFYETFHETNLGATIQARLEGLNVA